MSLSKSPRSSSAPHQPHHPLAQLALHPHASTTRFTRSAGIIRYGHPSSSRPAAGAPCARCDRLFPPPPPAAAELASSHSCVPMVKASASSSRSPWHRPMLAPPSSCRGTSVGTSLFDLANRPNLCKQAAGHLGSSVLCITSAPGVEGAARCHGFRVGAATTEMGAWAKCCGSTRVFTSLSCSSLRPSRPCAPRPHAHSSPASVTASVLTLPQAIVRTLDSGSSGARGS